MGQWVTLSIDNREKDFPDSTRAEKASVFIFRLTNRKKGKIGSNSNYHQIDLLILKVKETSTVNILRSQWRTNMTEFVGHAKTNLDLDWLFQLQYETRLTF